MADATSSIKNDTRNNGFDNLSSAATQVKEDVERLVEGFDLQAIAKRVEDFGRENPVGLAVTALTFGVALGILMRNRRGMMNQQT